MDKVKIYFSEEDLNDMLSSFYKEEGIWNTWNIINPNTGNEIVVELILGQED